MAYLWLMLAAFCSVAFCDNYCNFIPPKEDIDWKKVNDGPWRWVAFSSDSFMDNLVCSDMSVYGQPGNLATVQMRYGPLAHQVYTMTGEFTGPGEYNVEGFTNSWKNIVRYKKTPEESQPILDLEIETPKKNHVVFYTDYKSYIISAVCLPTGEMSVGAYTSKRFITPRMKAKVRRILLQHGITSEINDVRCFRKENKKLWSASG